MKKQNACIRVYTDSITATIPGRKPMVATAESITDFKSFSETLKSRLEGEGFKVEVIQYKHARK